MIDLLTRLRDAATPDRVGILPPRKLYTEAADEIERLSAQVEEIVKVVDDRLNWYAQTDLTDLGRHAQSSVISLRNEIEYALSRHQQTKE